MHIFFFYSFLFFSLQTWMFFVDFLLPVLIIVIVVFVVHTPHGIYTKQSPFLFYVSFIKQHHQPSCLLVVVPLPLAAYADTQQLTPMKKNFCSRTKILCSTVSDFFFQNLSGSTVCQEIVEFPLYNTQFCNDPCFFSVIFSVLKTAQTKNTTVVYKGL